MLNIEGKSAFVVVLVLENEIEDEKEDESWEKWSGRRDSNSRPPAPKAGALARLRYVPNQGREAIFNACGRRILSWGIADWRLAIANYRI
jgi:hypothetical protein